MIRAALALALLLAWALARRVPSPRQRVIAPALTGLLAIDVVRPWLASGGDADVALFVAWWALTAGAVWSVLGKGKRAPTLVDGPSEVVAPERTPVPSRETILLLACVLASPIAYHRGLDVGRASFALALAAQLLAALRFASRGRWPDDAQRVALLLAASSLADVAGPWLSGFASRDWHAGKWPAVVTWIVVAGWEARCLTRARKPRGTY